MKKENSLNEVMTIPEAWDVAVQYTIQSCHGMIQELLSLTNNSPATAFELMKQKGSYSFQFGNFGVYRYEGIKFECMGNAGSHPIHVWLPGHKSLNDVPDLTISWVDIFKFVATSKRPGLQSGMFE